MNYKFLKSLLSLSLSIGCYITASAQGMHFSQYYNSPMLLNHANTALLPLDDYQLGANYRQQWAAVPVPYETKSFFGSFQATRNQHEPNWLGLGFAVFNDKTGNGELSLTKTEAFVAYHIQLNYKHMISAGLSGGYTSRSIDFSKLSFNEQWDGLGFNGNMATGEQGYFAKTNYMDVGVGVNYAYMPNEDLYAKAGFSVSHVNTPVESFLNYEHEVGMRPTVNLDLLVKASPNVIINPSVYYTRQRTAYELLYGTMFMFNVVNSYNKGSLQFHAGVYHRWNDAIVPVAGLKYNQTKLTCSYDVTISDMNVPINGRGGFEISLIYENIYGGGSEGRRTYMCPRF